MRTKKDLINLIKKIAQDMPDAPGIAVPKPAASPPPPNLPPPPPPSGNQRSVEEDKTGVTNVQPSTTDQPQQTWSPPVSIMAMQKELQGLAKDMTKQVNIPQLGGTNKELGQDATSDQMKAASRMSFADFITQHYTRDSDLRGVELDWDPSKTEISDRSPSKETRTNVVMDTMTRIGTPPKDPRTNKPGSGEFAIDGKWGPRTNAALRSAYAMAFGMLEMAKEFHYRSNAFSEEDLRTLRSLIPDSANDISVQDKIKRAGEIAKLIKAVRNLYYSLDQDVFQKGDFKPYIEGSQAYASFGPEQKIDPKWVATVNPKFTNLIVKGQIQGQTTNAQITVNDLVSPDALANWQKKNMPDVSLADIIGQLKQQLGGV